MPPPVRIEKLGTVDCDMVETTPIVFRDRPYLFEYVRTSYWNNPHGKSYFRFVCLEDWSPTAPFGWGRHLGSAYSEEDVVYVYSVDKWGGSVVEVLWSRDLDNWRRAVVLNTAGWGCYNTSVCRADDGYVMALEVGEPPQLVGRRFTIFFARSDDLLHWKLLPTHICYSKDRYTACPSIRFIDGWFYMTYLEEKEGPLYETFVARSRDLADWEPSQLNPMLHPSPEDKKIANPSVPARLRDRIRVAQNINNSDVDLCEHSGKTILAYSWGNQRGNEFLALAAFRGTMKELFESFYPH